MDSITKFKKYIYYSVALHGVVFTFFLVLAEHAPIRRIPETKITMVRLIPRLGLPTGAPEGPPGIPEKTAEPSQPPPPEATASKPQAQIPPKTQETKPAPPQAKAKAPEPKTPAKSVVHDTKKRPAAAPVKTRKVDAPDESQLAQALTGIDSELAERERQLKEAEQTAGTPGAPNAGQAALGSPQGQVNAQDPGYARYQSTVRSKIIKNWVRTHAGSETQRLTARIRVQINASGAVISKSFAKSSGDAAFDNSAMRAVEQASPLPPPPPEIMAEALREGFVVDFRARLVGSN